MSCPTCPSSSAAAVNTGCQKCPKPMGGKSVFEIDSKTVVDFKSAFKHKLLCDGFTFSLGSICVYSCSFCYVIPMILKLAAIQMVKKAAGLMGKRLEDVVVRRRKAIKTMRKQLTIDKPAGVNLQKKAVIYTSPLVDAAANMVLVRETAEACRMIFELTNWDVRVLSKSSFLKELAIMIPEEFKMRMIYGFSTGTLDDELCKSFEKGTAWVSKRLKSLYWLQDNGYRTFGMLCPILPQRNYAEYADKAAKAIRVEQCEHVWGEVINVRGDSLVATCKALEKGGFTEEMERLNGVCGPDSGEAWEQYARAAFEGLANRMPPGKLRFLQYVKPETLDWWFPRKADGAVLLGSLMS